MSTLWHHLILPGRAQRLGAQLVHSPYGNRRLAKGGRAPVVATVHDLAEREMPGRYGRLRRWHLRWIVRGLRKTPLILAVSLATKRQLIRAGIDPERVVVTSNGLRAVGHMLDPSAAKALVRDRFGVSVPYLLYVARIEHPAKNHVRLVEALAKLHNVGRLMSLVLAGEPWTRVQAVRERIAAHDLEASVHMVGFVSDDELGALYSAAEALVFPSLAEGFGLPVLEALAAGLPVACADRPPMIEVFAGAVQTFDPESSTAIAEAVMSLLDDRELRQRLIARGREICRDHTWSHTARQTGELYRELCCSSPDAHRPRGSELSPDHRRC